MKEQIDSIKEQISKIVNAINDMTVALDDAMTDIEKINKLSDTLEKREQIEQALKKLKEKE